MAVEFYDLKLKKKVEIPEERIRKVKTEGKSGVRYTLKATTEDGRKLNKFVKKDLWDSLNVPEGEA